VKVVVVVVVVEMMLSGGTSLECCRQVSLDKVRWGCSSVVFEAGSEKNVINGECWSTQVIAQQCELSECKAAQSSGK
jgi:hypothetical protein